jgi:hypothetical protein
MTRGRQSLRCSATSVLNLKQLPSWFGGLSADLIYRPSASWSENDHLMVARGKQRTHFTILFESPMRAFSARFNLGELVVFAWDRIAVPPNCSPSTPNSDNKVHRARRPVTAASRICVIAHGVGLKTQPRFAQDPKLPQLRQQAANSA